MTDDDLPHAARLAHGRMLDAFDAFARGLVERERAAMRDHLLETGMTPERAAQGAEAHVARIEQAMQIERARLEAEGARTQ